MDETRDQWRWPIPLMVAAGVLMIAPLAHMAWLLWKGKPPDSLNTWGDFVGGYVAAGGSLASTVLLFGAVMIQGRELHLQREELKLQRQEIAATREVHKEQAKAMAAHTKAAADQVRALEQQARASWQGTVISAVVQAIESQRAFAVNSATGNQIARLGLECAADRAVALVDALTCRAALDFDLTNSLRKSVGLPPHEKAW